MKTYILGALFCTVLLAGKPEEPKAFKIFDNSGKEVTWTDILLSAEKNDVVLFGELHNNPISHWLQLELCKSIFEIKKTDLVLGAEMFESDQQLIMNEYLGDVITEKNFEAEMRLWTNHKTDYKPLLNFAHSNKLSFIATNVPRRYASLVSKKGKDILSGINAQAKQYLCPLPLEVDTNLKSYRDMLAMDMGHSVNINLVYAQALKDATMANFIVNNVKKGGCFIHFNGAFHSDIHEGIGYYIKKYNNKISTMTISTVLQKAVNKLEDDYKNKADFIIVVDEDMTSTH